MTEKRLTPKEMKEKLNQAREKIRKSVGKDDVDEKDIPEGPHFMPRDEIELRKLIKELRSTK